MTISTLDSFCEKFLQPAKGDSPEQIANRIRHWIEVCNRAEEFCQDSSPYALSAKRRSARQNLRRLVKKHPLIAEQIRREAEGRH